MFELPVPSFAAGGRFGRMISFNDYPNPLESAFAPLSTLVVKLLLLLATFLTGPKPAAFK